MPHVNGDTAVLSSLDSDDYDPIDHLNALFSHPSTLSEVSQTSRALRSYQHELDLDISAQIEQQTASDAESVERIQEAKADLAELFKNVEGVRKRAIETEEAITQMTADIKRLDNTKKNLALSMTALKRLQMLTTAYEQLKELSSSRQYKECAQLLQAVIQLMAHFKSYRSIDQIATLSRNVSDLQREMLEQVCEDFEVNFAKGEVAQTRVMLAEGCLVMDALGDNARSRLITWYCNTQLREYRHLFRGSEEAGSLENISMRYSWFKRMLRTYDNEHAFLFPPTWRVNEMLANAFCEGTRDDFRGILQRSARRSDGQTLDVDLLLRCLQETLDFEHGLEGKFTNVSRASTDTMNSGDEKSPVFSQAISEAFEPYLSIWVEAQDKHLTTMLPKYRQEPPRRPDEEFSPQMVITSSTDLFNFYRLTLSQCAKLSPGARLVELTKVFAKYLDQYAQQVLLFYVSERPSGQTPSKTPNIEDLVLVLNTADYCYNTSTQLEERIKGRIDPDLRSQIDLQSQADAFMGIASATIRTLVRRVEVDLDPCWREMRNVGWSRMEKTGDESSYIAEMNRKIKSRAAEILAMLHKQQYARSFCDNLVELTASAYMTNIFQCRPISEVGAEQMLLDIYSLKSALESLPSLNMPPPPAPPSAAYAKRIATSLSSRISPLLKTLQVRSSPPEALVQAYLIHIADKSDANFRKVLELKGIAKSKDQIPLLEIFQAHKTSPRNERELVQSSPILTPLTVGGGVGGGGSTNLTAAIPGSSSATIAFGSATAGAAASGLGALGSSAAASLSTSHLPARFDPSTLGSAIITAARDGVDRIGSASHSPTPTPGINAGGSSSLEPRLASPPPQPLSSDPVLSGRRAMSPDSASAAAAASGTASASGAGAGATGNLNENLRNIGKFFRRDLGGFGGRFGGGGGGGSGGSGTGSE